MEIDIEYFFNDMGFWGFGVLFGSYTYMILIIRMLILSFLRKPRKFYIQDMGSIHGTYLKLKHREQKKLLTGQTYQIGGTEVYINIM